MNKSNNTSKYIFNSSFSLCTTIKSQKLICQNKQFTCGLCGELGEQSVKIGCCKIDYHFGCIAEYVNYVGCCPSCNCGINSKVTIALKRQILFLNWSLFQNYVYTRITNQMDGFLVTCFKNNVIAKKDFGCCVECGREKIQQICKKDTFNIIQGYIFYTKETGSNIMTQIEQGVRELKIRFEASLCYTDQFHRIQPSEFIRKINLIGNMFGFRFNWIPNQSLLATYQY